MSKDLISLIVQAIEQAADTEKAEITTALKEVIGERGADKGYAPLDEHARSGALIVVWDKSAGTWSDGLGLPVVAQFSNARLYLGFRDVSTGRPIKEEDILGYHRLPKNPT